MAIPIGYFVIQTVLSDPLYVATLKLSNRFPAVGQGSQDWVAQAANEQRHARFSITPAAPMPPPMHMVTRPNWASRRLSSCSNCTVNLAPVQPSG